MKRSRQPLFPSANFHGGEEPGLVSAVALRDTLPFDPQRVLAERRLLRAASELNGLLFAAGTG